jgi:hypothetical protein
MELPACDRQAGQRRQADYSAPDSITGCKCFEPKHLLQASVLHAVTASASGQQTPRPAKQCLLCCTLLAPAPLRAPQTTTASHPKNGELSDPPSGTSATRVVMPPSRAATWAGRELLRPVTPMPLARTRAVSKEPWTWWPEVLYQTKSRRAKERAADEGAVDVEGGRRHE